MISRYFQNDIPSIHLYYSSEIKDITMFNEILWGVEEEGIPCEAICKTEDLVSEELSYNASLKSRLSVGIGIDKNEKVTLTYNKLNKDKPLFKITLKDDISVLRALGSNAGRLVKGMAFKEI